MLYIKINQTLFPARVTAIVRDPIWNWRDSKSITLEMTHAEAAALFVDGAAWSEVIPARSYDKPNGETVTVPEREIDCSDYCVAGSITDHRNGTVTVKMGKKTDGEMLAELLEVLKDDEG